MNIAWIDKQVLDSIKEEAERMYPLETGGCLLGHWSKMQEEVVICDFIGPGPNATHKKYDFKPDSKWQAAEIARIYIESGYLKTYLGDWHTHPEGPVRLSWKDKRTLRRIALYEPARAPFPLMAILGGTPRRIKIWKTIRAKKILLSVEVIECEIKEYS